MVAASFSGFSKIHNPAAVKCHGFSVKKFFFAFLVSLLRIFKESKREENKKLVNWVSVIKNKKSLVGGFRMIERKQTENMTTRCCDTKKN